MRFIPYVPPYDRIPHGFCPADEEEFLEEGEEAEVEGNELIEVVQLPVIVEQLHTLKDKWEKILADASKMVCTEDTIQAVKKFRADINKEFDEVEELRKASKQAIMSRYNAFEAVYKECITEPRKAAVEALTGKIVEVEDAQKKACEENLRAYFDELCVAHHLDWLTYERAGIKVDMASAKAKVPKKLREQLVTFVVGVSESVERISALENAPEIMVEFQRTLNAADAILTVQERRRRIEEQKAAKEARKAVQEREEEMVRRVEAIAPPVIAQVDEVFKCTFTVMTTKPKLKKLKEFLKTEGIQYE